MSSTVILLYLILIVMLYYHRWQCKETAVLGVIAKYNCFIKYITRQHNKDSCCNNRIITYIGGLNSPPFICF